MQLILAISALCSNSLDRSKADKLKVHISTHGHRVSVYARGLEARIKQRPCCNIIEFGPLTMNLPGIGSLRRGVERLEADRRDCLL
jgi:hypothetical protein